jgi:hypothetical protein
VELVVHGHRLIDLLHLIVRHLAVAGLWSLNGCTEARVSSRSRGYGSRRSSRVSLGLQLTSFTEALEMPATSVIASTPRSSILVPQRIVTVTEPQGSRIPVSTSTRQRRGG